MVIIKARNSEKTRTRIGVYTSGVIATTTDNRDIILFETNDVRCAVTGNPNTSTEIQRILEDHDNEHANKRELGINPDTPSVLLY